MIDLFPIDNQRTLLQDLWWTKIKQNQLKKWMIAQRQTQNNKMHKYPIQILFNTSF